MSFAIRVDNLGKRYRLGLTHAGSIRELVNRTWKRLLGRQEPPLPHEHAELQALAERQVDDDGTFWALRDVSFEVQSGEVVGIIGRNGSGKSTLLKIVSQITAPTTGRVELHGRVASLLEVGTGFHPELSGRENVFLNGAILGMTKIEIRRKFDEIVAFAEIEKFIDTPVKRYSSGMYVRLAFAVAAHLEPEILLIDEVLAVGDASFQERCLGKMGEVARGGRTVFFVSHDLRAVERLTRRSIVLDAGQVYCCDDTQKAIAAYQKLVVGDRQVPPIRQWVDRQGSGEARIQEFRTRSLDGTSTNAFALLEPFHIDLTIEYVDSLRADIALVIENVKQQPLFTTHLSDCSVVTRNSEIKQYRIHLSPNLLREGDYLVSLTIVPENRSQIYDLILHYPAFRIAGQPRKGTVPRDNRWGNLYLPLQWELLV